MKLALYNETDVLDIIRDIVDFKIVNTSSVQWKDGVLNGIKCDFVLLDDTEDETIDYVKSKGIATLRDLKKMELSSACHDAILSRFQSTVDGVVYEFSYDMEAQSRFNGTPTVFNNGYATTVDWTAYLNGTRTSVTLDQIKFNIVAKDAFNHCNDNLIKNRNKVNYVDTLNTKPEIEAVTWDSIE